MIGKAAARLGAIVAAATVVAPLHASGCVAGKTMQIRFARGDRCWSYRGKAEMFDGFFTRGQKVAATSTSISGHDDGVNRWKTTEAREVHVYGPAGFLKTLSAASGSTFVIRKTGAYSFDFTPCAMWGYVGDFVLCTT